MKKRILMVLLCLLMIASACGKTEIRPVAEAETPAPEPQMLSFETSDLDGNAVASDSLFASHEITMVNVMTTWCTYCIQELPELQRLNDTYAEKDCAIVGLLYDGTDDAAIEAGKELMEEAGASYPVLRAWDGMEQQIPVQAFPTTFFVNRAGEIVGETILGANLDGYSAQLDALLAQAAD